MQKIVLALENSLRVNGFNFTKFTLCLGDSNGTDSKKTKDTTVPFPETHFLSRKATSIINFCMLFRICTFLPTNCIYIFPPFTRTIADCIHCSVPFPPLNILWRILLIRMQRAARVVLLLISCLIFHRMGAAGPPGTDACSLLSFIIRAGSPLKNPRWIAISVMSP